MLCSTAMFAALAAQWQQHRIS